MSAPIAINRQSAASQRQRQRGVYALEWAIIFVVFFMLLYAIISFGLGYLVRQSMQWAVEDGARAALQFEPQRATRKANAKKAIAGNLAWLPAPLIASLDQSSNFSFQICQVDSSRHCTEDMNDTSMVCNAATNKPCLIQIQLTLAYAQHSFTPSISLGLMELAMPNLQANAQILIDKMEP